MPRLSKKQHFLRNFAKHGLGKKGVELALNSLFLYEVHHDHQPEHGECQSDFDGSSDDNADPGRNTYAPRVKIISFGPELADECTDERHDEDAYKTAHEDTDEGTNDRTPDAVGAGTGLLCPGGLRHSVDDDADDGKNGERRDRAPADQFETACPSDQGASCGDQRKSGNGWDDGAGEARR